MKKTKTPEPIIKLARKVGAEVTRKRGGSKKNDFEDWSPRGKGTNIIGFPVAEKTRWGMRGNRRRKRKKGKGTTWAKKKKVRFWSNRKK